MRIAILTSHVIQYQTPLFRKFAAMPGIDLTVYFCWDFGVRKTYDAQFGMQIEWDIPLLDGYRYIFLKNRSPKPSSGFWGQVNPSIIRELRKGKYDAILVYGWNSFTNWLAFFTAFIYQTPVFLHGENPLNQERVRNRFKKYLKRAILGWLFTRVSALPYIGEENRKFYKQYGVPDAKLFFTPYAVDNERFMAESYRLASRKSEFKRELGITSSQPVILFVGKFIDKKRPLDLLKAYEKLITDNRQPTTKQPALVFVGDGELRPKLEEYTKKCWLENVHFVGFKNQTELPKYYTLADVFVLPSGTGETWGLVVNEAMCFGLPVVVSDVVGCGSDLVHRNENGFIFRLGNIDELAVCIRKLVESRDRVESFGKRSKEIIARYSHEKDIEGIKEALNLIFL